MTIQFYCPNCDSLIAFEDKHAGKRARCTTCGQILIIPSKDGEKPKKIKPEIEEPVPEPGFYRAVFLDSWKLFVSPANAAGLVFVAAVVCFKFFTGHLDYSFTIGTFRFQAPVGFVVSLVAWGCLFWYYIEIINSTAFDVEQLPEVYMGGLFGFLWNIVKSLYIFTIALVIVQLPCIIAIMISRKMSAEWPVLLHTLTLVGLFFFPMAILTIAIGRDLALLRPDYILSTAFKAFRPYFVVAGLLVLAWSLQLCTVGYGQIADRDRVVVGLHLLANLAVQILAIIAMRSIGLFYRHYTCHLRW
jgi:ribosomal protein S27E